MLTTRYLSLVAIGFWIACVTGCSEADTSFHPATTSAGNQVSNVAATAARDSSVAAGVPENILAQDKSAQDKLPSERYKRKLVYSGDVRIEVKDFQELEKDLPGKVEQLGGFVGSYIESRRDLRERSGTWIVRVPVDQFAALLEWLDSNFYVAEKSVKSKDITEEFIDLQSRVSNKRKTELRLSEHLAKSTSKLSEILEMEKEIERVRGEIERIEGRLNLLRDQSELSTLTIRAESRATFVAAKSPSTLGGIGTVFYNSWWAIGQMTYALIVLIVATLPFALILTAIAFLIYFMTGQTPTRIFKHWREHT